MSDRSALCSLHASLVKDMKYIRLRDRYPDLIHYHYVYRVFQPERCTLSLQKTDDEWHPSQLAGKQNREASKETWQVVNDWFAAATGSQQDIDPHSDPDS